VIFSLQPDPGLKKIITIMTLPENHLQINQTLIKIFSADFD